MEVIDKEIRTINDFLDFLIPMKESNFEWYKSELFAELALLEDVKERVLRACKEVEDERT